MDSGRVGTFSGFRHVTVIWNTINWNVYPV